MTVDEAIKYACNLKRFECRDLTFGDTEVFLEDASGNEVGGGYFGTDASLWFTVDNTVHGFTGQDAYTIRKSIPVGKISRNDNGGIW